MNNELEKKLKYASQICITQIHLFLDVASQEKRVQVLEGAEMVAKSKEKFRY